jgi:hypothetical protein
MALFINEIDKHMAERLLDISGMRVIKISYIASFVMSVNYLVDNIEHDLPKSTHPPYHLQFRYLKSYWVREVKALAHEYHTCNIN